MCKGRGFSHEAGERGLVGFFIDRSQFEDSDCEELPACELDLGMS